MEAWKKGSAHLKKRRRSELTSSDTVHGEKILLIMTDSLLLFKEDFDFGLDCPRQSLSNVDDTIDLPVGLYLQRNRRLCHYYDSVADHLFIFPFNRAGELTNEELERLVTIMQNPTQYKVPQWFLNRQKNFVDGKYTQLLANGLDNQMREDLERLKKIRAHRGLRHYWGVRVRGQHTKTTGRRGRVVGVSKKK